MPRCSSRRNVWTALCVVAMSSGVTSPVFADPIRITAGHTSVRGLASPGDAVLVGDGLQLIGLGTASASAPTQPGEIGTLDGQFSYQPNVNLFDVMVNGQSYRATLSGLLTFTTEPFVTPAAVDNRGLFNTTFTMSGRIVGFSGIGNDAQELFSIDVFGTGTASANARFVDNRLYLPSGTDVFYSFTAGDVSPTPEPASLLLLATGAVGLVARSRRRR